MTPAVRSFATVIQGDEWACASVLADALAEHHPGSQLHVLVLDQQAPELTAARTITVHDPSAAGIPHDLLTLLRLTTPRGEARLGVIPAFIAHLLRTATPAGVTYLAPDTAVLGPLPDMGRGGIGLLPRFSEIPVDDGRTPSADDLMSMSVFDDGFLIAGPTALDPLASLATDVDASSLASPVMLGRLWTQLSTAAPTTPLKDPALGVAYWNAHERTGPFTTVRLPGLTAAEPYLLSRDQGEFPRVLLSERPDLQAVVDDHLRRLHAHGMTTLPDSEHIGKIVLDDAIRSVCRQTLATDPANAATLIALADDDSGGSLAEWLMEPAHGARDARITRYLIGVWSCDAYAKAAFPDPGDLHAERFIERLAHRQQGYGLPARFLPRYRADVPTTETPMTPASATPAEGVNLIGFLRAGFGQGEAARLMHEALTTGGIPHAAISLTHEGLDDDVESSADDDALLYDINLSCVNVDALETLSRRLGIDLIEERYTIGTIWWESNLLPSYLVGQMNSYLDEVWAGSTYIAKALESYTERPICVFPLPVRLPEIAGPIDRAASGLPDGYLFMFSFDFNSTVERKNPEGVIEAFRRAFPSPSGPQLVVKTINGHRHLRELERLRAHTADRDDIVIYDGFLPTTQRDAWACAADCYVSLHRSEGFGLTMAEAMAMGKPVIATAFSANLDFMNDDVAFLVPADAWRLEAQAGPYPAGSLWADPDLDVAAQFMRNAAEDPQTASKVGESARDYIATTRTPERLVEFVAHRLSEIREHGLTPRPRPNSRLTQKLNDALSYDRQRQDAMHGPVKSVIRKAMRPYTAAADELDRRLLSAMVELGGRLDELAQDVRVAQQELDLLNEGARDDAEDVPH